MNKKSWSAKELSNFKTMILKKRNLLQDEIIDSKDKADEILKSSTANALYSSHMADASGDHVELEQAYYMIARLEKYLGYLAKALQMITDGTFGICISCNNMIPKARLEEVPHTTKCVDCKEGI